MKFSIAVWTLAALFGFVFVPAILPVVEPTGSSGFAVHTIAFFASIFMLPVMLVLGLYQIVLKKFRGKTAVLALSIDLFFAAVATCVAMHLSNQ